MSLIAYLSFDDILVANRIISISTPSSAKSHLLCSINRTSGLYELILMATYVEVHIGDI